MLRQSPGLLRKKQRENIRTRLFTVEVVSWFRRSAVERWSLTGELSMSCGRPTVDG